MAFKIGFTHSDANLPIGGLGSSAWLLTIAYDGMLSVAGEVAMEACSWLCLTWTDVKASSFTLEIIGAMPFLHFPYDPEFWKICPTMREAGVKAGTYIRDWSGWWLGSFLAQKTPHRATAAPC
jgi:hypothetical protein